MKSSKRGNPRKSRRPLLPSSSFTGRREFEASPELLKRLENALGVSFTDLDRSALTQIVNKYFARQPFESAAPLVADAERYLSEMQTHAQAFLNALVPKPPNSDAAAYVQRIIMEQYRRHKGRPADWNDLATPIQDFLRESAYARGVLSKRTNGGFKEGDAFKDLLRNLTQFCEDRAWPTAASKGVVQKQHRFLPFVQELQKAFPAGLRRHDITGSALAKAISDARHAPSGTTRTAKRSG